MKLKNIFASLLAATTMLVGCQVEGPSFLDEIKVSSSFVSLPADGGEQVITMDASYDWKFVEIPSWVTVSPSEGKAGNDIRISFRADKASDTRDALSYIVSNNVRQTIKIQQVTEKKDLPISTCAEVIASPSGTYRLKGIVQDLSNTTYGNWNLNDGTGIVYIYGTLDKSGAEKNFLSLGIDEGDEVTVEGPAKDYNGTIELVNVTVINITKSLLKVDSLSVNAIPLEGGKVTAFLMNKCDGLDVQIPSEAASWLSVAGISTKGTSTQVSFAATPNNGGDRSATVTFKASASGKNYEVKATIAQEGAIVPATAKEFNAAADGSVQYRVSGVITSIANTTYGNFYIKDYTGEQVYVYGTLVNGADKKFSELGLKVGDIVEMVGAKSSYNGAAQMKNGAFQWSKKVSAATAAEVNAMEDDDAKNPQNYVLVKGKVTNGTASGHKFDLADYGNFDLVDESGSLYVYGVTTGWNGESKKFGTLNVKEGDIITLIGYKTSYKGTNELVAFYVSHESDSDEPGPADDGEFSTSAKYTKGTNAYDDGVATVNETPGVKFLKIGTSKAGGDISFTIPAGKSGLKFYAVSWKGADAEVSVKIDGTDATPLSVKANDGATGSGPYTFTVTESDSYKIELDAPATADVTVSLSSETRVLFFGVKAF